MGKFFHEASIGICFPCLPCLPLPFFSMTCEREAEMDSLPYGRKALFFTLAIAIFLPGKHLWRLRQHDVAVEHAAVLDARHAMVLQGA